MPPPPPVYQTRSGYALATTILGPAQSVAMSTDGTRIGLGPHRNNCADAANNGCAGPSGEWRVVERTNDGTWVQAGYLPADSSFLPVEGDSIALNHDGTVVAVWSNGGSLRVFEVASGSGPSDPWVQRGQTVTNAGRPFAHVSLSEDGNILAYGDNRDASVIGVVRVFQYDPNAASQSQWGQIGQDMSSPSGTDRQYYGQHVVLSADGYTVFASAAYHDSRVADNLGALGNLANTGIAMVHTYDAGSNTWNIKGNALYGDSESYQADGPYGISMSADGTRIAYGAPWGGPGDDGMASVRDYSAGTNTWETVGTHPILSSSSTVDAYGSLVRLSADGHTLIVAHGPYNQNDKQQIEVLVYNGATMTWTKIGLDGPVVGGYVAVSGDGSRIAIPAEGYYGGDVRVYEAVEYP